MRTDGIKSISFNNTSESASFFVVYLILCGIVVASKVVRETFVGIPFLFREVFVDQMNQSVLIGFYR